MVGLFVSMCYTGCMGSVGAVVGRFIAGVIADLLVF